MKPITLGSNNPMHRSSCPLGSLLIPLVLACLALLPQARATCQQGCLTNINTALGDNALISNTTGTENAAFGEDALSFNTTGFLNTAVGSLAMVASTTSSTNTAIGAKTLALNSTGHDNTAIGYGALNYNGTGINNVAIGSFAGSTYGTNGSSDILIGYAAGTGFTTGSNNIDIGNTGAAADTGIIRVGTSGIQTATFVAGIAGTAVTGGVPVRVNASGKLGTAPSSELFEQDTKPMDRASEVILALKPVTFRYKQEVDPEGIPQFGLVAEDVEKVNPDLVARDEQGKPYTVRYEAVNAMLLNEFLKEHRTVQEQGATIARLEKQVEALTAGLQKVSARLQLNKVTPQTVLNMPSPPLSLSTGTQ